MHTILQALILSLGAFENGSFSKFVSSQNVQY